MKFETYVKRDGAIKKLKKQLKENGNDLEKLRLGKTEPKSDFRYFIIYRDQESLLMQMADREDELSEEFSDYLSDKEYIESMN